jgi:hypothetical protein
MALAVIVNKVLERRISHVHRLYICSAGTVVLATGVLSLRLMYMHVSILCTADSRMRVGLAQRDFLKRYFNNIRQNFDKHG